MGQLLIRNVPDEVIAGLDARAARLGISRSEFLRRRLAQEASAGTTVTVEDLRRFADSFPDLLDEQIMRGAWE
jgi:plasmid stability protein